MFIVVVYLNAYRASKWVTRRLLEPDPCVDVDMIFRAIIIVQNRKSR